uniref:Novel immune-type receptor 13 n=1 Tax=Cyclopterus lumpus TaxID=8103 RepID=A0A8C3A8U2_CYCLU
PIRCAGEGFSNLIQTAEVPQQVSLTLVELGGNVTLWCPVFREGYFYWYKQTLGHMIQTVARVTFTGQKLSLQLNNTRFKVTGGKTRYSLTIRNITKEDEATYFCFIGTAYGQSFVNVTFLAVKEPDITFITQDFPSAPVRPGDSVTLQCSVLSHSERRTCPGEPSVFWFRVGSDESHPSLIYAQRSNSAGCEKSPEAHSPQKCVYSFSKDVTSSDVYTHYCAVATCGQILFGNGTKLDIEGNGNHIICMEKSTYLCVSLRSCKCATNDTFTNCQLSLFAPFHIVSTDEDLLVYSAPTFSARTKGSNNSKTEEEESIYTDVRARGLD